LLPQLPYSSAQLTAGHVAAGRHACETASRLRYFCTRSLSADRAQRQIGWIACRRRIAVGNVTSHCRRKTEVLACLRFDAVRTGWPVPLHFDFFASFVLSSDGRVGVALRNMAKTGNEQPGTAGGAEVRRPDVPSRATWADDGLKNGLLPLLSIRQPTSPLSHIAPTVAGCDLHPCAPVLNLGTSRTSDVQLGPAASVCEGGDAALPAPQSLIPVFPHSCPVVRAAFEDGKHLSCERIRIGRMVVECVELNVA
jgi:hypothetical protein